MAKTKQTGSIFIGSAGWALRKEHAAEFSAEGTHLTRYAERFSAVEINSSFYKPHKPATYSKWATSVPSNFRFAVKIPKEITHTLRLVGADDVLNRFLTEATALGKKLGPLLVQLPPILAFDVSVAETFFATLRKRFEGYVVLEPRHATWFEDKAERLVTKFQVGRVVADPPFVKRASEPGGWDGLKYYRLHGSPRMYYSTYDDAYLEALAGKLVAAAKSAEVWCIFDNTAEGAATVNALDLIGRVSMT